MIKAAVEFINNKLSTLNYFEKSFGLCESIIKGDKSFPAEYSSKGEYKNVIDFDKFKGVSYIRKNGNVSISDADNTLQACAILSAVDIPFKLIAIVPRSVLKCDNNYSEDVIAQTIMKELLTKGGTLKATMRARTARIQVNSYNTNSISIIAEEYTGYPKSDINYKFAYISLDISMLLTVTQECLTADCDDAYS